MRVPKLQGLFFGNLSFRWVHVSFVTSQRKHEIIHVVVVDHLVDPVVHTWKWPLISHVVTNYWSWCISVVQRNHCAESLRPTRIPNVQFYACWIGQNNFLLHVGPANCHVVTFVKVVFAVAVCNAWFPHSRVSKQNHFSFVHLGSTWDLQTFTSLRRLGYPQIVWWFCFRLRASTTTFGTHFWLEFIMAFTKRISEFEIALTKKV